MIAEQTLRKGISLVNVYPCRTRGSACISVEVEVHGVGICRGSSAGGVAAVVACLCCSCDCLWDETMLAICDLNPCFFSSGCLPWGSAERDLGSPSHTSISMHRQPRSNAL